MRGHELIKMAERGDSSKATVATATSLRGPERDCLLGRDRKRG